MFLSLQHREKWFRLTMFCTGPASLLRKRIFLRRGINSTCYNLHITESNHANVCPSVNIDQSPPLNHSVRRQTDHFVHQSAMLLNASPYYQLMNTACTDRQSSQNRIKHSVYTILAHQGSLLLITSIPASDTHSCSLCETLNLSSAGEITHQECRWPPHM